MLTIRSGIRIDAKRSDVWAHLADLASHPEWMADAEGIEFATGQTSGPGTSMRVPTRLGPFRLTDELTVVAWEEGRILSVAHEGLVKGKGSFELQPSGAGTRLIWTEALRFPWWLGGDVAALATRPILKRIWEQNLERLRRRIEVSGR